jgi:hypothetical protein
MLTSAPSDVVMSGVATALPSKKDPVIFNKYGLQIKLKSVSPPSVDMSTGLTMYTWSHRAIFMNITSVAFEELNFMVSVPKAAVLRMEGLTSTVLAPLNTAPASQLFTISAPTKECKFRFKVVYSLNEADVEEMGEWALSA